MPVLWRSSPLDPCCLRGIRGTPCFRTWQRCGLTYGLNHAQEINAILLAYNPEHQGRMKHVARRHFYLRELVEDHRLRVPFVSTVDNLADFFTKALKPSVFYPMRDRVMNVPRVESTGGR